MVALFFAHLVSYNKRLEMKLNDVLQAEAYVCYVHNKNSSGDEIANVLVNDDIAHT